MAPRDRKVMRVRKDRRVLQAFRPLVPRLLEIRALEVLQARLGRRDFRDRSHLDLQDQRAQIRDQQAIRVPRVPLAFLAIRALQAGLACIR